MDTESGNQACGHVREQHRFEQVFRGIKVPRLEKKMRNMGIEDSDKHDQRGTDPTSLTGIARRESRHNFHSVIGDR
jgi:hypothetical protein